MITECNCDISVKQTRSSKMLLNGLIRIVFLTFFCVCEASQGVGSMNWMEELFGEGLSAKTLKEKSRKHLASSTEDLLILLDTEERLLRRLKNGTENEVSSVVKSYLNKVDYLE
jgi:hypothetical protein